MFISNYEKQLIIQSLASASDNFKNHAKLHKIHNENIQGLVDAVASQTKIIEMLIKRIERLESVRGDDVVLS